jgi:hypothetical protein
LILKPYHVVVILKIGKMTESKEQKWATVDEVMQEAVS